MSITPASRDLYKKAIGVEYEDSILLRTIHSLNRLAPEFFACIDTQMSDIPNCVITYTNKHASFDTAIYQYDLRAAYLRAAMDGPTIYRCLETDLDDATHAYVECEHGRRLIKTVYIDREHDTILGYYAIQQKKLLHRWASRLMDLYLDAQQRGDDELQLVVKNMYRAGVGMLESNRPQYAKFHYFQIARSMKAHLANMIHARLTPAVISAYTDSISLPFADERKNNDWWKLTVIGGK
ncbi:MAG: hypothetical protein KGJ90_06205 [Patescibacteria group bacterium]|nr:hypothetical protein [Patescibacteria group bacterium]